MKKLIKDKKPIASKSKKIKKKFEMRSWFKDWDKAIKEMKLHNTDKTINRVLIQNAIYIVEDDLFLKSTHVHDYIEYDLKDGTNISIDGGNEYLHYTSNINDLIKKDDIEDYNLYSDCSFEEIKDKLLWATYGIKGDQPKKWVLLKNCETDHLKNILKMFQEDWTNREQISIYEVVIKFLLWRRNEISKLIKEK